MNHRHPSTVIALILCIFFSTLTLEASPPPDRIGCIYNGFILTVDPGNAVSSTTTADRHRLYVLHALLIDTATGRIAATYPQLPSQHTQGPIALPVADYPELFSSETPPAPGIELNALITYWRNHGVDESLLTGIRTMNLDGAVMTPGLIDDHFHVTSWSKKVPAPGEKFGFWADVGDPAYYTEPATMEPMNIRKTLWQIVTDSNIHLADIGDTKLYLHGFLRTIIDEPRSGEIEPDTYMYESGGSGSISVINPLYLLNRIGTGPDVPTTMPPDPVDPSTWPPLDYTPVPVVMVHTSGQACWYNPPVLDAFNAYQQTEAGEMFTPVAVTGITPPASPDDAAWVITVSPDASDLLSLTPPFSLDIVAWPDQPAQRIHVPFQVTEVNASGSLSAQPFFTVLAETYVAPPGTPLQLTPFYRIIPSSITDAAWSNAAAFYGDTVSIDDTGYGDWDPRAPHTTNWYNGAERGLIEYFHDRDAGVWRPTGYAEHYVMRDALSHFVLNDPTTVQCMEQRRRMARWCHRHGITAVNDIMFYRRATNTYEFESYEHLSYDHTHGNDSVPGRRTSLEQEPYNLRVKLYYYIENAGDIDETLALAHDPGSGYDIDRLIPETDHPEWPGWVRWQGWKIQLDGGTGARTICSSALITKMRCTDPYETVDQTGNTLTFLDHSFGLLTMTNIQEQIFNSRETAALYWLVRESDPASPFHNPNIANDWSFLAHGVTGFLDRTVAPEDLVTDLNALDNIEWPLSGGEQNQPDDMAQKIIKLVEQIQDGYRKTLITIATIWYEQSVQIHSGKPISDQHVSHCLGDGAVDLWCHAIRTIRDDLAAFPENWGDLPDYWQAAIPPETNLDIIRRTFNDERFRVEHLLSFSSIAADIVTGPGGLNTDLPAGSHNILFSTQPALLACDGQAIREYVFPYAQELWPIENTENDFWLGVPWRPRSHHHMPCPVWRALDIPFTLNTDPPSIRDPRPCVTLSAAVARTPFDANPAAWVGRLGNEPVSRPVDYLAGRIYPPLGLTQITPDNPMGLTVEETLCAITFWAAVVSESEDCIGAFAAPPDPGNPASGYYADMVIWRANPLAIRGSSGMSLEDLAVAGETVPESQRLDTLNAVFSRFLPRMTFVGGAPVWQFGVRMDIPVRVRPGETFFINGFLDNPGPPMEDVPVFFLLDVYGEYFFWPGWAKYDPPEHPDVDYRIMDLSTGTTAVEVLPPFTWPDAGEANGFYMYGAMLNTSMTDILGEMAIVEFGCDP